MDRAALIEFIDQFLDAYADHVDLDSPYDPAIEGHLYEWHPLITQIAQRVVPAVLERSQLEDGYNSLNWHAFRQVALAARGALEMGEHIATALGHDDTGPNLDAHALHPTVWDAAKSFWRTEHYRQGVQQAALAINAMLQQKLDRRDISGADLIRQAFSLDPPTPGAPRLRRWPDDGSDTYRNMHLGPMHLGQGLHHGIRNVAAHELHDTELDPQIALEQLATFSVLARWIDDAHLETATDGTP